MTANERFIKNTVVTACITVVIILLFFVQNEPIDPIHRHAEVNRYYANGMRPVPVIMCMTDSMQVIFGTDHKVTELSIEYFSNKGD